MIAAIAIELHRGNASFRAGNHVHALGTWPLVFVLTIVLATIVLSFLRFRSFTEYRVIDALFGFSIDQEIAKREPGKS